MATQKWIRKFGIAEVLESTRISFEQYLVLQSDGGYTIESINKAFEYIPRICSCRKRNSDKPYMNDLYYIRGILKKRFRYVNGWMSIKLLEKAYLNGYEFDELKYIALSDNSWSQWRSDMEILCEENNAEE